MEETLTAYITGVALGFAFAFVLIPSHTIYIPAYEISINSTPYEFILIENQTMLAEICHNVNSAGCTDQHNKIWIWSKQPRASFEIACNHEVLHNILLLDTYEENWGESEEHKVIISIQSKTKTPECDALTERVYG